MKTLVKGRNFELDDELRDYIERKLGRLDRLAHRQAEADVELISQASHASDRANVVEVTLRLNGDVLRSSASGPTPHAALDVILDKLERQMVRHNERPRTAREKDAPAAREARTGTAASTGAGERLSAAADDAAPIVKVKRFDMEPMFEEDALARMEELQHAFFVFLNAESGAICVLYRRRDGKYGLIEPVIGARRRT